MVGRAPTISRPGASASRPTRRTRGQIGPSSGERHRPGTFRAGSWRIPAIVRDLEKATVEIARLVEEGERQAEIERKRREADDERWRREEEARRAAKALEDSKEELLQVIDAWAEAKRLEAFFADAERRARDLPDGQRERTVERLQRARALIGSNTRDGDRHAPREFLALLALISACGSGRRLTAYEAQERIRSVATAK